MESERDLPLGLTEAVIMGLLHALQLLVSVVDRVKELMQSEGLDEFDQDVLDAQYQFKPANETDKTETASD